MFNFLSKSASSVNLRVNSICINKFINLHVAVRYGVDILKLTARAHSIYREVYA